MVKNKNTLLMLIVIALGCFSLYFSQNVKRILTYAIRFSVIRNETPVVSGIERVIQIIV